MLLMHALDACSLRHSIPRAWHTATYLPGKELVIVFGGERNTETGTPDVLDDLMVLDIDLMLW